MMCARAYLKMKTQTHGRCIHRWLSKCVNVSETGPSAHYYSSYPCDDDIVDVRITKYYNINNYINMYDICYVYSCDIWVVYLIRSVDKSNAPRRKKKLTRENIRYINNQDLRHYYSAENIICSKNNTIKNICRNYIIKQIHFLFICKHFIIAYT